MISCLSFALYVIGAAGTPTVTVPASKRPRQACGTSSHQAPAFSLESSSEESGGEAAPLTSRQALRLSEMVASQLGTRTVALQRTGKLFCCFSWNPGQNFSFMLSVSWIPRQCLSWIPRQYCCYNDIFAAAL